jgi:hypothetical protein
MNRLGAAAGMVLASGIALSAAGAAPPLVEPAGPAETAVANTLGEVLRTGRHPWLRWASLADVAPALRELYGAEADGLFWFAGEQPYPALSGALNALAAAAERGLEPADYDVARVQTEWQRLEAPGTASAAERALFDLAVSIGVRARSGP